jgi:prepilin-type N-terminal cleavage/methylation domain-containing protein
MDRRHKHTKAGFTLVEVLIVSVVVVVLFVGLFAGTKYSLELIAQSRAKLSAITLASDRMELFRSLPYSDVGTEGGIPAGAIPQQSTTTLNNIIFTERVIVEYIDDVADGQLTATSTDDNDIPSDYKRIKIEISWNVYGTPGQISLVSNIVPRSIETTEGGGTVRINVIDQDSLPLSGAEVRLMNSNTTSTIDTSKFSDANGAVLFSGAPASSGYEITVSGTGYSIDQTYVATTSNPNPITAPFTVLESDISTLTFQIDLLSDIDITAYSNVSYISSDELFSDGLGIATSTNTAVSGGELSLADVGGIYETSGTAFLVPIQPSTIIRWEAITLDADAPPGTDYRLQIFTLSGSSTYELVPEEDLPGNSVGFTSAITNIGSLDTGDYNALILGLTLETTDTDVTPTVNEVRLFYRESETPLAGASLGVRGNKVIGTALDASPIYKYNQTSVTDGGGQIELTDMEFDNYTVSVPAAYDVAYSCPALPLTHRGGVNSSIELEVAGDSANSLQVKVINDVGENVPGASVTLEEGAFSDTVETNPCGAAFFSGLTTSTDYIITISKPAFQNSVINPHNISGDSSVIIVVTPS